MCVSCPAVRVGWSLPAVEMEYPDSLERYKLFAKFFLEGQVLQPEISLTFISIAEHKLFILHLLLVIFISLSNRPLHLTINELLKTGTLSFERFSE